MQYTRSFRPVILVLWCAVAACSQASASEPSTSTGAIAASDASASSDVPSLDQEVVGQWKLTNVGQKDKTGVLTLNADGTCALESGYTDALAPLFLVGSNGAPPPVTYPVKGTYKLIDSDGWDGTYIGFNWGEDASSPLVYTRMGLISSTRLEGGHLQRLTYSLQGHSHGVETLERVAH
jgi:hypothetical protein